MTNSFDQFSFQKAQWIEKAFDICKCNSLLPLDRKILEHLFDNLVHILRGGDQTNQDQLLLDTIRVMHSKWSDASTAEALMRTLQTLQLMQCATRECATTCLPQKIAEQVIHQVDALTFHAMDLCVRDLFSHSKEDGIRDPTRIGNPDVVTVVAHELRTPLTLIRAYADMMTLSSKLLDQELKQMLQGIIRGAERLETIISDMLDTTIIHEGEKYLEVAPIKLNGLLLQACSDMTPAIEMRGQTLMIKSFPSGSVSILGDHSKLKQALWNVLSNAVKYTPDGGEILVESVVRDGFIEIHVQDQGVGIPEHQQRQIFAEYQTLGDPRFHSSSKVKFNGGGLGLGLALAKGIVEAHGGMIWVRSPVKPGDPFPGTSFHLLLPTAHHLNLPH